VGGAEDSVVGRASTHHHRFDRARTDFTVNKYDLRKKAEAGNVVAESMLGICYLDGIDVGVDYREALRFLSSAAEKGAARAALHLVRMHADG